MPVDVDAYMMLVQKRTASLSSTMASPLAAAAEDEPFAKFSSSFQNVFVYEWDDTLFAEASAPKRDAFLRFVAKIRLADSALAF
mmetsp:Transcript_12030/g.44671  ORF Transcript_12030/g.44671 Transcript_12030/m.44671 type:complete len:84 (+) Transcript_12030:907-1158(+)